MIVLDAPVVDFAAADPIKTMDNVLYIVTAVAAGARARIPTKVVVVPINRVLGSLLDTDDSSARRSSVSECHNFFRCVKRQ